MKHLYVFYFFATLLFGSVSLAITTFIYTRTREKSLRYYLYMYVSFTLIVVFYTALSYLETNVPSAPPYTFTLLNYLASLSLLSLIFVVPYGIHHLAPVSTIRKRNVLFAVLCIAAYVAYHIVEFIVTADNVRRAGEYLISGMFIAVMLYCVLLELSLQKTFQDPAKQRFEKHLNVFFIISLPGLFYDLFLNELSSFRFYPILYCALSLFFIFESLRYSATYPHTLLEAKCVSIDEIFQEHDISSREQEVVTLVLQGYSNQKIAEALFISLNTVKAHLRNIYPKFEIGSRYELISLFKDAQNVSASGTTEEP